VEAFCCYGAFANCVNTHPDIQLPDAEIESPAANKIEVLICVISTCSNGLLDPWSSGGILRSISGSVVSLLIPEGAHHLDLRGSNPKDPASVISARKMERQFIKKWIGQAAKRQLKYLGPDPQSLVF
jgi:hypothetical protein